ncbi:hypothetical protein [Algoriphagus aquimarinus]|uniref:hypothetical protein n=1 Tax=Algoriphagus aquimarinus TaxID=237018 RepID=UPI0030DCFDC3|tara:strand:- start:24821 stop:25264 length:444 start_codon:yes stop_codon:yes gene_type:complete
MKTPKLISILIATAIILWFTVFRGCTSRDIGYLSHETVGFKELPVEVQQYLENPTDTRADINSMILEIPKNNEPRYKLETVKTWIGPWVDHSKVIDIQTNKYYEIDRGVPSPYIIFDDKLYIPNTYNIFTTVYDLNKVKFTKYNLED